MNFKKRGQAHWRHLVSAPFIYACLVPIVFTDLVIEIYHRICFALYGIPYVKRGDYVKIDRHRLSYLNWMEKLNCVYCGYANGVLGYFVEIAGQTEKYWCGIKHQQQKGFHNPEHHKNFPDYGDKKAFNEKYN